MKKLCHRSRCFDRNENCCKLCKCRTQSLYFMCSTVLFWVKKDLLLLMNGALGLFSIEVFIWLVNLSFRLLIFLSFVERWHNYWLFLRIFSLPLNIQYQEYYAYYAFWRRCVDQSKNLEPEDLALCQIFRLPVLQAEHREVVRNIIFEYEYPSGSTR